MKQTLSSLLILQAIANGYRYGFEIMAVTGLPSGTVYPALRRFEERRWIRSKWEKTELATQEKRPPRRYYELRRGGREGLMEAADGHPLQARALALIPPRTSGAEG